MRFCMYIFNILNKILIFENLLIKLKKKLLRKNLNMKYKKETAVWNAVEPEVILGNLGFADFVLEN